MNRKPIISLALAALVTAGAAIGVAMASERGDAAANAAALANARITLSQAITTAEQSVGGRAIGADLHQEKGALQIEVDVVDPQGIKTVVIDAQSGLVTATRVGGEDDEEQD